MTVRVLLVPHPERPFTARAVELGRIPIVGEVIAMPDGALLVRQVRHVVDQAHAAEVLVQSFPTEAAAPPGQLELGGTV